MTDELPIFQYNEFSEKTQCGRAGRFGTVFVATHRHFPKVALRVISRRHTHRHNEEDERLLREAKTLFGITSANVIRLHGVVMDEVLGLVYEYAEFGPLDKLLIRHKLQWALKIRVGHEIAVGMDFLHSRNIIHRRLKSRNILITGNIQVKISDLFYHHRELRTWSAIASQSSAVNPLSQTRESTVAHIPPECSRNINLLPEKSWDVYAYGIILWEIATGKIPYENETEICRKVIEGLRPSRSSIPHDRPDEIYKLMGQCWEANPEHRPNFEDVSQRLKILFKPHENEARNQALQCQTDIKDFFFSEGIVGHPESDIYRSSRRACTSSRRPHNSNQLRDTIKETASSQNNTEAPSALAGIHSNGEATEQNNFLISTRAIVESPETKNSAIPTWINVDDSPRQVNTNDLYVVAGCIETDYRGFGKNVLNLPENDIDIMEEQYDDCTEISYQMLRRWKENADITPTVSYLVKVLKSRGYSQVADHLRP